MLSKIRPILYCGHVSCSNLVQISHAILSSLILLNLSLSDLILFVKDILLFYPFNIVGMAYPTYEMVQRPCKSQYHYSFEVEFQVQPNPSAEWFGMDVPQAK